MYSVLFLNSNVYSTPILHFYNSNNDNSNKQNNVTQSGIMVQKCRGVGWQQVKLGLPAQGKWTQWKLQQQQHVSSCRK